MCTVTTGDEVYNMQCNLLTSVIKPTFFYFHENRNFDCAKSMLRFFSILVQNRDFDVVRKNRHALLATLAPYLTLPSLDHQHHPRYA